MVPERDCRRRCRAVCAELVRELIRRGWLSAAPPARRSGRTVDEGADSSFIRNREAVVASSIPFNRPCLAGNELTYVGQAIALGQLAGDGEFSGRCSALLEDRLQIHRVLLTNSCTAALEMAAMLCELGPGDEVVMPSFTFVSTANAVVRCGATPVFVDVRPDTLNLDETQIESVLGPRTRAIFPVHYAGVACEMGRIRELADKRDLIVVEDAAQAVNASWDGRPLGSIGHLAAFSFHETKNFICGEGGALAINDARFVKRAEILRDKGTDRQQFFRGEVDKYTWVDTGSSYTSSELVSAFSVRATGTDGPNFGAAAGGLSALSPGLAFTGSGGAPKVAANSGELQNKLPFVLPGAER